MSWQQACRERDKEPGEYFVFGSVGNEIQD
ncbi:hypothetical protein COLO4_24774 [Corchorus olitorius]|uniref:Uncharacterized protein n=1 Tax=Corchorus olitorius TaxID=93759 RepID=A0A1R3I785_9ROSI|nr:hypothetical protein COLO4_24774 [Corchorus olitorius]